MFGVPRDRIPTLELVMLLGVMMSLGAMTQDIMLPALRLIDRDLATGSVNGAQYVITASLIGIGVGQLFYGPMSDCLGRRRALFFGLGLYAFGSLVCISAVSFEVLLIGRALQGIGAASPRVLSTSIARDLYEGRAMARVLSYVMAIQMFTPVVAPAIGQYVIGISDWWTIFYVVAGLSVTLTAWIGLRLPETLPADRRKVIALRSVVSGYIEAASTPVSFWYSLALGITMGSVIGFTMSSPQIFADLYGITTKFPYYFGGLCVFLGMGSIANARLVMRCGMRRLCFISLISLCVISIMGLRGFGLGDGGLSRDVFLGWAALSFLLSGALFGNLNAIAMKPLGNMAGLGAALVGSLSTFAYVGFGTLIGQSYDGSLLPVIGGFLTSSVLALSVLVRVKP